MDEPYIPYHGSPGELIDRLTQGTPYGAAEVIELAHMLDWQEEKIRTAMREGGGDAHKAYVWARKHQHGGHKQPKPAAPAPVAGAG